MLPMLRVWSQLAETQADLTRVRQEADAARAEFREDLATLRAQHAAALDAPEPNRLWLNQH